MSRYTKHLKSISIYALIGLPLVACTTSPLIVQPGDKVEMSFSCRLPGGGLAATTRPDLSVFGEAKAPLYLPRTGPDTVSVTAGPDIANTNNVARLPFEQEIIGHLAPIIPGMKEGAQRQLLLEADRYPVSAPNEKIVELATVRKRQKEMRLSREEYSNRTGKTPEVGQPFVIDKLVPGKVSELTEKEVVIRFTPVRGADLVTPFGPVSVRESADHYELEIAAEKGRLIRTGGMVGLISDVDSQSITIDYGHPFAGEKLECDVKVVKVVPQGQKDVVPSPAVEVKAVAASPAMELDPKIAAQLETALLAAYGTQKQAAAAVDGATAAVAANGDLATVNYTAMLEDGAVFYTTSKIVAEGATTTKAPWFSAPKDFTGELVAVGKAALFPGIGDALAGMSVGATKRLVLTPEQAFGPSDPQKLQKFPLMRTMPRTLTVPAEEYVKRFNGFPTVGQEIPLTPYFPAKVSAVHEREVDLLLMAENGKTYSEPFGSTNITVDDANITTILKPVIGAVFPGQSGYGVVTAIDATSFTVDMNNPLAGKTVTIELELTGLTTAASLPTGELPWLEEHDAALAQAKKDGKPAVLVLHAEWCSFCKKLFSETMPDPRISALRDKFTWIKVNSDQMTEYKKLYGQEGFPMIVLFKADGSIAQKLDGYQEASRLRAALQEVM